MFEARNEKSFGDVEKVEALRGIEIIRPVGVDLFFIGVDRETSLPLKLVSNPRLLEQARQRRDLYTCLGSIFKQVKDVNMDISEAIDNELVSVEEVTEVYEQLGDFIETDENNTRLILYLPIQLISNINSKKVTEKLAESQSKLRDVYKQAWIRLLHESEPRASFVDGDILEPGMGKPPRIRKAAHLVPDLLQRGILTTDDVFEQLDLSSEEELIKSLLEGMTVAKERQLITEESWQLMQEISQAKQVRLAPLKSPITKEEGPEEQNLEAVMKRLDDDLSAIDNKYAKNSPYVSTMSQKRAEWEKSVKQDEVMERAVCNLTNKPQKNDLEIVDIEACCGRSKRSEESCKVGVRSLAQTAEVYATLDLERAKAFTKLCRGLIQKLWDSRSLTIKDEIISCLSHWRRLEIIQDQDLQELGIRLPDLSSPFPVNLQELAKTDLRGIIEAVRKIKTDPILSEEVYPFILVFGSRLKGYAGLKADLDVAVFVKQNVTWEKRNNLVGRLRQEITELKDIDKILEFWVEDKKGKLGLRQTPEGIEAIVGAPQIHFLLGGVWVSHEKDYRQLYEDLIEKYLDLSRFGEQKDQVRTQLLRQMELDILQYRLMHKGYRRFYPNKRDPGTQNSNLIDWDSDFWDPGYRRVATQLFLSRVFLPDLATDLI